MRVDDPLAAARRPRRVTHRRRLALIQLGIDVVAGIVLRQQLLVVDHSFGQRRVGLADHDNVLKGHARSDRVVDIKQTLIDDQHSIVSVIGDVGDLFMGKPQVERVQHGPSRRNAKVGLLVLGMVPAERRHAIAAPDSQRRQGERELFGSPRHLTVAATIKPAVTTSGDDLSVGIHRLGPP
ncbi:MAG: hypothetical protein R3C10_08055 [Pirellulales bacterium]